MGRLAESADGDMTLTSSGDDRIYNLLSATARQSVSPDEMPLVRNILKLNLRMDHDAAFGWVDKDGTQ